MDTGIGTMRPDVPTGFRNPYELWIQADIQLIANLETACGDRLQDDV